jgi:alkylated DNA repair dioxygenase AlkB
LQPNRLLERCGIVSASQFSLFEPEPSVPEGFRYQAELISPDAEQALVEWFSRLPFRAFEFQGYVGKRRVVSFGWLYDFNTRELRRTEDMPACLLPLRELAAGFAGISPADLQHALVTEYPPGSTIGWHKDKAVFADVVGISLLAPCVFRLRRRRGETWERISVRAEPRSAYLLRGSARSDWEHSIPPVDSQRYSVTFRTFKAM